MKEYLHILKACSLFRGVEEQELPGLLGCLGAVAQSYGRGQAVLLEGDPADRLGIVLRGSLQVVREDYYGSRSLLAVVHPGELFAEAFACAGAEHIPVSVIAAEESRVLLIDRRRVLTPCANACSFHSRLIGNLLEVVARKNLLLNGKIECMSPKTTREKLMTFLLRQAKQHNSSSFAIPFDRQQLADYLGVERSAMSAELGRMRRDGLLEFRKNQFRLLGHPQHEKYGKIE